MNAVMNMDDEVPLKVYVLYSLQYTLQVDLLSYMWLLGLISGGKSTVFCLMAPPFYTPMNIAQGLSFLHTPLTNMFLWFCFCVFREAILMDMSSYLMIISLMFSDTTTNFLTYKVVEEMPILVLWPHFTGVVWFSLFWLFLPAGVFYVAWYSLLFIWFINILSHLLCCLSHFWESFSEKVFKVDVLTLIFILWTLFAVFFPQEIIPRSCDVKFVLLLMNAFRFHETQNHTSEFV